MRSIVSSCRGAVCRVICRDLDSAGTGFFVRQNGVLLTCCHVVSRFTIGPRAQIQLDYSQEILIETTIGIYPASIVHDPNSTHPIFEDYAVLKIDAEGMECLPLGDYSGVESGDGVLVAGYPFGVHYPCATLGMISAKHRSPSHINRIVNLDMIQVDGSVSPGNSGGPLVHIDSSSVVGIVSVRLGNIEKNIENLTAIREVRESLIFSEIVSTLEEINTYLNPGIGQATSIEYAKVELDRLGI